MPFSGCLNLVWLTWGADRQPVFLYVMSILPSRVVLYGGYVTSLLAAILPAECWFFAEEFLFYFRYRIVSCNLSGSGRNLKSHNVAL
jgi:hypothetical protein